MSALDNKQIKERPTQKYQHTYQQLGYSSYSETPKIVKNLRVAMSKIQDHGKDDEADDGKDKKMKLIVVAVLILGALYYMTLPAEDPGAAESVPAMAP